MEDCIPTCYGPSMVVMKGLTNAPVAFQRFMNTSSDWWRHSHHNLDESSSIPTIFWAKLHIREVLTVSTQDFAVQTCESTSFWMWSCARNISNRWGVIQIYDDIRQSYPEDVIKSWKQRCISKPFRHYQPLEGTKQFECSLPFVPGEIRTGVCVPEIDFGIDSCFSWCSRGRNEWKWYRSF